MRMSNDLLEYLLKNNRNAMIVNPTVGLVVALKSRLK